MAFLTWIEIIAAFFVLLLGIMWQQRKPKNYPPGPLSLPIIGNLHQLGTHPFIKFMAMQQQYGDIFAIDFGPLSGIIFNTHKIIREALSIPEFSGRPKLRPFLEKNGGMMSGIAMNEGAPCFEHRRFTLRNLRDFGFGKRSMESIIMEEVQELLNTLSKLEGAPFKTKSIFHLAVVNSLWWITAGERFHHSDKKLHEIVKLFTEGLPESPAAGAFFFFPWISKIAPDLSGYNSFMNCQFKSRDLVQQKLKEETATFQTGVHRHLMDVYIEATSQEKNPDSYFYGEIGQTNMLNSITDLFLAGIETTSTALSWTAMLLCVYPEIQEKLHSEIISVVGESTLPSLENERNLPYTMAVINEILRYSSIVPLAIFHSTTDTIQFHGYTIPKDTMIVPNIYAGNRDPEIWSKDGNEFKPERFIKKDGTLNKELVECILTFSTGKRVCIGETLGRTELFLFITSIFQKYKFEPNPDKPKPVIDYMASFVLQPKPYEYIIRPRY